MPGRLDCLIASQLNAIPSAPQAWPPVARHESTGSCRACLLYHGETVMSNRRSQKTGGMQWPVHLRDAFERAWAAVASFCHADPDSASVGRAGRPGMRLSQSVCIEQPC